MNYVILLFLVFIFVSANGMELKDFIPFGKDAGDQIISKGDDYAIKFSFKEHHLPFYGHNFNHFYLSVDGILTFHKAVTSVSSHPHRPSIAPYHTDLTTTFGDGNIFYRFLIDQQSLDQLSTALNIEKLKRHTFQMAFIVTWHNVSSFSNIKRTNTFQTILIWNNQTSFGIFNYHSLYFDNENAFKFKIYPSKNSHGISICDSNDFNDLLLKSNVNNKKGQWLHELRTFREEVKMENKYQTTTTSMVSNLILNQIKKRNFSEFLHFSIEFFH